MTFRLSSRSNDNLEGVDKRLISVVRHAITVTKVDFGVVCGLRTVVEQRKMVESGASKTMKSKHITGQAVDLMAYLGGRGAWELPLYDEIADAMAEGGRIAGVPIRWGGAWTVPDITKFNGSMEHAMNCYIEHCRLHGKRPFIDAPHFEIGDEDGKG
jgi:peptidoglycan L-alanyl-D-glutamate endopeptidase CwlK